MGLYTYDLEAELHNIITNEVAYFRSIRELARYFKVSLNFIRPRIIISNVYPLFNKYKIYIDYHKYLNHIAKLNNKRIYVYSHITNKKYMLSAYTQISILFGIPYTTVEKYLNKNKDKCLYTGGYTFSLNKLINIRHINSKIANEDREKLWLKTINNIGKNVGPK